MKKPNSLTQALKENPVARLMAQGAISILYNTLFMFQRGPKLTSDKLQISMQVRYDTKSDVWYEADNEIRQFVAKQNPDGRWDVQQVSSHTRNLESWTSRSMVRLGTDIESVREIFATHNRIQSPTGREVILKNKQDEDEVISRGGRIKTTYLLSQKVEQQGLTP